MFKFVAIKSIAAVAASAVAAGLFVALTSGVAPVAQAEPWRQLTGQQHAAVIDPTVVVLTGAGCSSHAWPNYDQSCLFDLRKMDGFDLRKMDGAGAVRVIALH